MKYIVVAVRDRATDAYMRPLFVASVGQAVRSFQDEVNRRAEDNAMWAHPDDFDLFELGTYDEQTGRFNNLAEVKQIAIGKQVAIRGDHGTGRS